MRYIPALICLLLGVALSPASAQEGKIPEEENCRQAITGALEQLRHTPPDLKERDDADRRKLLAEMERLVEENRRAGMTECETWGQLMRKASNQ